MTSTTAESPAYSSTTTAGEIARRLLAAQRVVVITHSKPDGDALGTTVALVRALVRKGVDARAVYVGPIPRWGADVIGTAPANLAAACSPANLRRP